MRRAKRQGLARNIAAVLANPFGFAGAAASATLLLADPNPLPPLRDALRDAGIAATILRPGLMLARWLGPAAMVREGLGSAIRLVRARHFGLPAALPRLWTC